MSYFKSLVAFLTFTVLIAATLSSAKNSKYERYKIEKAEVEYKISGAVSGSQSLIFDQFGMREKKITKGTVNQGGMLQQIHMANYTLVDTYYDMSLLNNVGNSFSLEPLLSHADSIGKKNLLDIQYDTFVEKGFTVTDGGKILGKVTQKFSAPDNSVSIWIWKNLPLKVERKAATGSMLTEATKINENPKINKSTFALPKDVKIDKK